MPHAFPRVLRSLACVAVSSLFVSLPAWGQGLGLIGTYDSGLGGGATEIAAYDAANQQLFVVNAENGTVDMLDLSDLANPTLTASLNVSDFGAGANSVAVYGNWVAVAVEADNKQANGHVVFFGTDGSLLGSVEVGALPDMVAFTPDGSKALVANEGEPSDDYTVDPEGSVSIIDLGNGLTDATVTTLGFTDFNAGGSRAAELPADVRVFGPNATVAQDLEPEYITVSATVPPLG